MATHGDLWLPLDPNDAQSPMLYCEAWSDGYLSGVGYGALSSSSRIEAVCALSALFGGSPIFYLPTRGVFQAKEADSLGEAFAEYAPEEDDADAMEEMVDEALAAISRGDAAAALSGPLSATSIEEKIHKGYGINAEIKPAEEAWAAFMSSYDAQEAWESKASAERLAKAHAEGAEIETGTVYCWRDGQFWGVCSLDDERWQAVPLIHMAALKQEPGCFGDLQGYLGEITEKDRESLLSLLEALLANGQEIDGLFNGECDAPVRSLYEASVMSASAASPSAGKRPGGL